jgi:hypothetical protein
MGKKNSVTEVLRKYEAGKKKLKDGEKTKCSRVFSIAVQCQTPQ